MTKKEKQKLNIFLHPDLSGKINNFNFINCLIILFDNIKTLHDLYLSAYRLKVQYKLYGFDCLYCSNQAWKQINRQ